MFQSAGERTTTEALPRPACASRRIAHAKADLRRPPPHHGVRPAAPSRTSLNPTFCIYPSFRKKADFTGFYGGVCAVRSTRRRRAAKREAKAKRRKNFTPVRFCLHTARPAFGFGFRSGLRYPRAPSAGSRSKWSACRRPQDWFGCRADCARRARPRLAGAGRRSASPA